MAGQSAKSYVVLLIDPSTGELEAFGPVDEPNALVLAAELQTALAADAELGEVGVLILPLQPTAPRLATASRTPAAG